MIGISDIGIGEKSITQMQSIFQSFPEVRKVILYGSRAIGNFKPYSDIDVTLVGNNLNLTIQQKIETLLDDLLLPHKIDVSIYDQIQNKDLIDHISRVGKVFYEAI